MRNSESLKNILNSLKNRYKTANNEKDKIIAQQLYKMSIKELIDIDPKYFEEYKQDIKELGIELDISSVDIKKEESKSIDEEEKEIVSIKEDKFITKLKEDIEKINTLSFITWLNNYKEYIKTIDNKKELNNKVIVILSSKNLDTKYKKMFINAMDENNNIKSDEIKKDEDKKDKVDNIDEPLNIVRVKKTFNSKVQNMVKEFNMNKLLKEYNLSLENNKIADKLGNVLFGKGIAGILYKTIKSKVLNNSDDGKIDKNYKKNRYLSMLLSMKNKNEYKKKFTDYEEQEETEENNLIQKGMGKVK